MSKFGKEIERVVLAEALQYVFEDRIFVTGNKTVIFV
jgi:formyltetrahydrofolate deformylase